LEYACADIPRLRIETTPDGSGRILRGLSVERGQLSNISRKVGHAMSLSGKLNLDCIVQRDPDVIAAEADQDLVMVSIANGFYYGVADVARQIWEAIERPKKISDLINDLAETYNVDRSVCEEETLSFLEDLRSERLLQVRDGPSS
jgi:hypothetical protein